MMIEPGITELDKYVDSRYTLVAMAAKRARMIGKERLASNAENGEKPYDATLDKPVSQAVKEIAKGVVGYVPFLSLNASRRMKRRKRRNRRSRKKPRRWQRRRRTTSIRTG